jgi:pimeloyl-ACP methyl ester carboxylesterase
VSSTSTGVDHVPLEEISLPTLIVHAADDKLAPYSAAPPAAARIAGSRLITIPRGAHLLLGADGYVRQEVSTFIKEVASGPEVVKPSVDSKSM